MIKTGVNITMSRYQYCEEWTEEYLFSISKELEGKRLGEVDLSGSLSNISNKGTIGNMIQHDFFGIPANSDSSADFFHHNIELKVTPIKKIKGGLYSSKERLVLSMINYMKAYKEPEFLSSHVYEKTKKMLIVFYLHEENKSVKDFKIIKTSHFKLSPDKINDVKKDYNYIIDSIIDGEAHLLTEKAAQYLSPCTKGAGKGKDLVNQPFSEIKAKSRAFSYKNGFMTNYFRELMQPEKIESLSIPKEESFKVYLKETLDRYIGKTDSEICRMINYIPELSTKQGKSYLSILIKNMFGVKSKNINETKQFVEESFEMKTVVNRLLKKDNQDMSFPNLDFTEIFSEEFEDSSWYTRFAQTNYVFIYFEEIRPKEYKLVSYYFWTPDSEIINTSKQLYNYIKDLVVNNKLVINIVENDSNGIWTDNFPGKSEFSPFQIRPKGTKKYPFVMLPNGIKIKKKALFIDKEYIRQFMNKK